MPKWPKWLIARVRQAEPEAMTEAVGSIVYEPYYPEPERPRTVEQQRRHLERFPPFVRNAAESQCDCCARHRACINFTTKWRHGQSLCEDCLNWLLKLLMDNDT